jgi:hypothetical protein
LNPLAERTGFSQVERVGDVLALTGINSPRQLQKLVDAIQVDLEGMISMEDFVREQRKTAPTQVRIHGPANLLCIARDCNPAVGSGNTHSRLLFAIVVTDFGGRRVPWGCAWGSADTKS